MIQSAIKYLLFISSCCCLFLYLLLKIQFHCWSILIKVMPFSYSHFPVKETTRNKYAYTFFNFSQSSYAVSYRELLSQLISMDKYILRCNKNLRCPLAAE